MSGPNGAGGAGGSGGRPQRPWGVRSRLLPIAGLLVGAAVIAILLVTISVGEHTPRQVEIDGAGEVQRLIGGIRQLGDRLGDEGAPVRITLFTDVTCSPRCADHQRQVVDPLIAERVRTGEAQITLRHFPLGRLPVTLGAVASLAAAEQGRQWQYVTLMMRNLDEAGAAVDEEFLREVAAALPRFNRSEWEASFADSELRSAVEEHTQLATDLRLPADPALIIEGPGGSERLVGAPSLEEIEAAIENVR